MFRFTRNNPTIVKFADGKYGIRKKILFIPVYLDIMDIRNSNNLVNWRSGINTPRVYSWCSTDSIAEANSILKHIIETKKTVKVKVMTEEEILKDLGDEKNRDRIHD